MRDYELMLVLAPDFDAEKSKSGEELVKKLLGGAKATLSELNVLGKKPLAYPIKKQTEGVYLLAKVTGEQLAVAQLEKQAKLEGKVLRFLLTARRV
ncbi:MAG: 30S ribosomal protein S6 [Patescibacteria group bacterium]